MSPSKKNRKNHVTAVVRERTRSTHAFFAGGDALLFFSYGWPRGAAFLFPSLHRPNSSLAQESVSLDLLLLTIYYYATCRGVTGDIYKGVLSFGTCARPCHALTFSVFYLRQHGPTRICIQASSHSCLLQSWVVHSLDRLQLLNQGLVLSVTCQYALHRQDGVLSKIYPKRKVEREIINTSPQGSKANGNRYITLNLKAVYKGWRRQYCTGSTSQ